MPDSKHRSIGEVLTLLQVDFPDVTISKIRFLESQGLIDPERTQSGYRKFAEHDINQLRWILHQQRDNFLPLKVIKERLETDELDFAEPVAVEPESAPSDDGLQLDFENAEGGGRTESAEASPPARPDDGGAENAGADEQLEEVEAPSATVALTTGVSFTVDELAQAVGMALHEVEELRSFGLIEGQSFGDTEVFDEGALGICKIAATFRTYGIEARHLRGYKASAQREAGLYEQILLPLLKQRDADSRARGREQLEALMELGNDLRDALLRQTFGTHLSAR